MTARDLTKNVKTVAGLFGPAASILEAARAVAAKRDRMALLFEGDPGIGKKLIADQLAIELTASPHAIETINGQSTGIEVVREWRERSCYGNLFSKWTVKRIEEIDLMSSSAMAEMLTYLDLLPAHHAILATTNEFAKLRQMTKGRLESRFIRFPVEAPTVAETTRELVRRFSLPADQAQTIARGAVPDGMLDGCNVRAAFHDAEALVALLSAKGKWGAAPAEDPGLTSGGQLRRSAPARSYQAANGGQR
jgi:MoxR-like ATPase